jgi:hypothetical protein
MQLCRSVRNGTISTSISSMRACNLMRGERQGSISQERPSSIDHKLLLTILSDKLIKLESHIDLNVSKFHDKLQYVDLNLRSLSENMLTKTDVEFLTDVHGKLR